MNPDEYNDDIPFNDDDMEELSEEELDSILDGHHTIYIE